MITCNNTLFVYLFQVIRTRTQSNIPPAYKEILFMTRQISSAVCRNPEVYKEVCENILRVDISVLKSEFVILAFCAMLNLPPDYISVVFQKMM